MKKIKCLLLGLITSFSFAISACNLLPKMDLPDKPSSQEDDTGIKVESIVLNPTYLELEIGAIGHIDATVLPNNATNKTINWSSSNIGIAAVDENGNVNARAAGEAVITAKAASNNVQTSCRVKVTEPVVPDDAINKYGVKHLGTYEDPLDNGDAFKIGQRVMSSGPTPETFYIKGVIDSFYQAPGTRADGAVSWYFEKGAEDLGRFQVYHCFKQDGSPLTSDDVWVKQEIIIYAQITYYAKGAQPETSGAVFISDTGKGAPEPSVEDAQVVTFNEVLEIGHSLNIEETAPNYYRFQAYLKLAEWENYYFTNSMDDILNPQLSSTTENFAYFDNTFELYKFNGEVAEDLTIGSLVEITTDVKNYYGQVENSLPPIKVEILDLGPGVEVERNTIYPGSVGEVFLSLFGNSQFIFEFECRIETQPVNVGQFYIVDSKNPSTPYLIEKSSPLPERLAWNAKKGRYDYEDNIDFKNSEFAQSLQIGDIIRIRMIRSGNNFGAKRGIAIILGKVS